MENQKFIETSNIIAFKNKLADENLKIVFTNGCFDLLHPGHIKYLAKARTYGDCLIIGLNSDQSVTALKGKERPINSFSDRVIMLAALESVNYIIGFDELTPLTLIQQIEPHVLIKGGDYNKSEIVGSEYVESCGGLVKIIAFEKGYSSSKLIEKIKKL